MVNGKTVKFSCEKSPSPKRFQEPEGMTDVDLRRLSQISGCSDSNFKKYDPKSMKKRVFKVFFILASIGLAATILFLLITNKGNQLRARYETENFNQLVAYYRDKLQRCKLTESLEDCCSYLTENKNEIILQDCSIPQVLQAVAEHEAKFIETNVLLLDDDYYYDLFDDDMFPKFLNKKSIGSILKAQSTIDDFKVPTIHDDNVKLSLYNTSINVTSPIQKRQTEEIENVENKEIIKSSPIVVEQPNERDDTSNVNVQVHDAIDFLRRLEDENLKFIDDLNIPKIIHEENNKLLRVNKENIDRIEPFFANPSNVKASSLSDESVSINSKKIIPFFPDQNFPNENPQIRQAVDFLKRLEEDEMKLLDSRKKRQVQQILHQFPPANHFPPNHFQHNRPEFHGGSNFHKNPSFVQSQIIQTVQHNEFPPQEPHNFHTPTHSKSMQFHGQSRMDPPQEPLEFTINPPNQELFRHDENVRMEHPSFPGFFPPANEERIHPKLEENKGQVIEIPDEPVPDSNLGAPPKMIGYFPPGSVERIKTTHNKNGDIEMPIEPNLPLKNGDYNPNLGVSPHFPSYFQTDISENIKPKMNLNQNVPNKKPEKTEPNLGNGPQFFQQDLSEGVKQKVESGDDTNLSSHFQFDLSERVSPKINTKQTNVNQSLNSQNSSDIVAAINPKLLKEKQNTSFMDSTLRISADNKMGQFSPGGDDQINQQNSANLNFANQRQCVPSYSPPLGSSLPIMQQQVPFSYDPKYAQLIPISLSRNQPNPYVINPQYSYMSPTYSAILTNGNMMGANTGISTSGPGGQYFVCNPIQQQTNHVAGMPGVEVRNADFQILTSINKGTRASDNCAFGQEMCADNSKCIKIEKICDGEVHCPDGSDEVYCNCKSRIAPFRLCDGYLDCPNGEDEIGCFGCTPDSFSCDDWTQHRPATCIPLSQRCDGFANCPTGKDEQDCIVLLNEVESSEDIFKVSTTAGFLHKNFKGRWYPACSNSETWAVQVCRNSAGPNTLPPLTHMIPINYEYKGSYANALPEEQIDIVASCVADRAVYVECPQPTCGMRSVTMNPYRQEEVDTSAEEIAARFRPARALNESETIVGDGRVVGGRACQPAAWPWVVSIYKNGAFHCGGVLISDTWLITASHCVEKYWQYYYEIELGMLRRFSYSPMQQTRFASHVIPHADYDRANLKNDLALMRLNAPVKFNRYVRPICLPTEFTAGQNYDKGPIPGTICTAVGWGATVEHGIDPDHMREVEVPVLPICKHKEDEDGHEICAGLLEGGRDACQGDSGGPFLCRNPNIPNQWYLAGVVSHGEGCARPNEPGVYTRIALYRNWIYEHAKDDMLPQRKPLYHCPGYVCKRINKCIPKKRRCDKIVDCLYGDDEVDCAKRNSISSLFKHAVRHMMLDDLSRSNGENASVEVTSPIGDSIAPTAFQMENTPITDPVNGLASVKDDTSFASPAGLSDRNEFISNTTASLQRLDESSVKAVRDPLQDGRFLCTRMLEIIPLAKKCDKVIDCQDGTDEEFCTCSDYLKNTHPEAICDGVTDCKDLSDESNCGNCASDGEFYCRLSRICIPLEKRCDNTVDCPQNEDEWDCFALSDKHRMVLDADLRPELNIKGVLAFNRVGNWTPVCGNFTGIEGRIAADVCVTLGFADYDKYLQMVVADGPLPIAGAGERPETEATANSTTSCTGLYVKCSNVTISANEIGTEDQLNVANDIHNSPWNAAVYANGDYKCTGAVLDIDWILTSVNCFPGILKLDQNYVAVLLGAGRGHFVVGGPHEQIIAVGESLRVGQSDVVLLKLREKLTFTRYVRPLHFQRKSDFVRYKETCVAMGSDLNLTAKAVLLKPVQNCTTGSRCFKRLDVPPPECKVDNYKNPWSGCIVCDSGHGFYPAAVFEEVRGDCGFTKTTSFPSLSNIKRLIHQYLKRATFAVEPPSCTGFRCKLGKCIGPDKLCNRIPDCRDAEDETAEVCEDTARQCHLTDTCLCNLGEMRCANGKCVQKSVFCDQKDDCGDGSDEPDRCTCQAYLRLADPSKICDGARNCLDRSDEDKEICRCTAGQFKCGLTPYCISNDMVCDGYKDCPDGEDEHQCVSLQPLKDNSNAGEVLTRTRGVWHPGCFPEHLTTSELEGICGTLGFTGSSASYLHTNTSSIDGTASRPLIDRFNFFWIHRMAGSAKVKLAMRTGSEPFVTFVPDPSCHRLFIECL
ncbi:PREDICTED: serine protease nudel-like [Nicrophorus vespilloides]|uniref:Serine protease nudel-like n=1 Tax=Nicrophorus vespilloides TaxID=110193 RepID=A0ABM1MSE6_NICVS|nr:PREDICTED: serine protease nudel-like [Nicrophorus vespilloides]